MRSSPRRSIATSSASRPRSTGTLRFNAAVFYNDYKDIQLPVTTCFWAPPTEQTPCASQANVGSAHVQGVEVEAEWNPGRFSLDASFG